MFNQILEGWKESANKMNKSVWFQRLANRELDLRHYKGFLLETYHHAGLNPQIQAFATMYFKENHRDLFGMFYSHARSEIGHDLLAIQDLENLGEKKEEMMATRPSPETAAFNAHVIYQIQFKEALSYLGYLFHLEFLPTQQGDDYIAMIKDMGATDNSVTFLKEHSTVDVGHNKMMEKYIQTLVKTDRDRDVVINAAQDSCHLHMLMINAGFARGEQLFKA